MKDNYRSLATNKPKKTLAHARHTPLAPMRRIRWIFKRWIALFRWYYGSKPLRYVCYPVHCDQNTAGCMNFVRAVPAGVPRLLDDVFTRIRP